MASQQTLNLLVIGSNPIRSTNVTIMILVKMYRHASKVHGAIRINNLAIIAIIRDMHVNNR